MKLIVPSGFSVAVHPLTGTIVPGITGVPLISVIVNGFQSGSVSFPSGLSITGVHIIVDQVSF